MTSQYKGTAIRRDAYRTVTVYDSGGDGMNRTTILFNDTQNLNHEDYEREKNFPLPLFCGENTYQCKGSYNWPTYASEISFKIPGDSYNDTKTYTCESCIKDKCTFNIACEPDSPESDNGAGQSTEIQSEMSTEKKTSVVFRNVESILCKNATEEICRSDVTDFHDYVGMLAQDNELRLSAVYDLFSECAPCIQETFLDSRHQNCVQPMTDSTFTCGDLSKHIQRTTMIKQHTHSIAFENAYHITNTCENCMDNEQDCENDVRELSNETLETCRDVLSMIPGLQKKQITAKSVAAKTPVAEETEQVQSFSVKQDVGQPKYKSKYSVNPKPKLRYNAADNPKYPHYWPEDSD